MMTNDRDGKKEDIGFKYFSIWPSFIGNPMPTLKFHPQSENYLGRRGGRSDMRFETVPKSVHFSNSSSAAT